MMFNRNRKSESHWGVVRDGALIELDGETAARREWLDATKRETKS